MSRLKAFDALISTANHQEEHLGAPALCLRCETLEEKRNKTGKFDLSQMDKVLSEEQYELFIDWRQRLKRTRHGVFLLT